MMNDLLFNLRTPFYKPKILLLFSLLLSCFSWDVSHFSRRLRLFDMANLVQPTQNRYRNVKISPPLDMVDTRNGIALSFTHWK